MRSKYFSWKGYLILLAAAAAYFLLILFRNSQCTARAIGRIMSVERIDHLYSHGGPEYALHIMFTAENVTVYTKKSIPVNKGSFNTGDEIAIMYNPRKPKRCYVDGYGFWTSFR